MERFKKYCACCNIEIEDEDEVQLSETGSSMLESDIEYSDEA